MRVLTTLALLGLIAQVHCEAEVADDTAADDVAVDDTAADETAEDDAAADDVAVDDVAADDTAADDAAADDAEVVDDAEAEAEPETVVEEQAEGTTAGLTFEANEDGELPEAEWFWSAVNADAADAKAAELNPPNLDGGILMSACFGLQSCLGFQNDGLDFIYAAREWECNVKTSQTVTGRMDVTSAQSLATLNEICPNILPFAQLPRPYDAMPTTFNFPVMYETLDMNGDDFVITMSDGTFTRPVCVFLDPANEPNEMHTVTIIGHFGGRLEGTWPEAIEVVGHTLKLWNNIDRTILPARGLKLERTTGGNLWQMGDTQYGHSMSYESGLVMLKALMYEFSERGEGLENHCRNEFPATTHVIKILFNGGFTINGIHPLLPSDTSLFTIMKARGETLLWNKFIGLADLGTDDVWKTWPEIYETDGDNYLDLCLQLGPTDLVEDILSVMIQADAVTPPRGVGFNTLHSVLIEHVTAEQYPYALEMEDLSTKLFWVVFWDMFDIIYISVMAAGGIIMLPVCGVLLAVGLLFAQAYLPYYIYAVPE